MKPNLPSTWTSEKISALFLLTFFRVLGAKAGKSFNNCLSEGYGANNPYRSLLNYSFIDDELINNGEILKVCCTNSKCSPYSITLMCSDGSVGLGFWCSKIAQTIFCESASANCGGIVSETPITVNSTIGTCSVDLNVVANDLAITIANNTQSYANWYCSNSSRGCYDWTCQNNSPCYKSLHGCNWDNGGWTCYGYSSVSNASVVSNDCFFQWLAPFPNFISINSNVNSSNFSSNDPHLAEKISIPIGTVVGIGSVSGLTYYLWEKRTKFLKDEKGKSSLDKVKTFPSQREKLFNTLIGIPKEELEKLKRENTRLAEKLDYYDPLLDKDRELVNLKSNLVSKASRYKDAGGDLDDILRIQEQICIDDNEVFRSQKKEIREKLIKKGRLKGEEIDHLCKLKNDVINLKIKLELTKKKHRLSYEEIQQINNIVINIQQGNAVVNSELGDNANLSYNNSLVDLSSQFGEEKEMSELTLSSLTENESLQKPDEQYQTHIEVPDISRVINT